MVICIIIIALGAICLTLFLLEKNRKYSNKAMLLKSATSLFFISLAAYSTISNHGHPFSVYILIGLALGMLGDIYLDFKYIFPDHSRIYTYAGFTVFGVGHILYVIGIMKNLYLTYEWYYIVLPLVLGTGCGLLNLVLEKPLKLKFGEYKWIVLLYGCLLFCTFFTSLFASIQHQFNYATCNMLMIGGFFFALSDLILSGTYFGEGKERPFDIVSNAVTYYAAQYLIAFSLFFI